MLKQLRNAEGENGTNGFWRLMDMLIKLAVVIAIPTSTWVFSTLQDHSERLIKIESGRFTADEGEKLQIEVNRIDTTQKVSERTQSQLLEKQQDILSNQYEMKALIGELFRKIDNK